MQLDGRSYLFVRSGFFRFDIMGTHASGCAPQTHARACVYAIRVDGVLHKRSYCSRCSQHSFSVHLPGCYAVVGLSSTFKRGQIEHHERVGVRLLQVCAQFLDVVPCSKSLCPPQPRQTHDDYFWRNVLQIQRLGAVQVPGT